MTCSTVITGFEKLRISVSVGAVITEDESIESSVIKADQLMHRAKKRKNSVFTEWNLKQIELVAEETEKPVIILIDDIEANILSLKEMLQDTYYILEAQNITVAITLIEKYKLKISVVLLNIVMFEMVGFKVLSYLKDNLLIDSIPVIILNENTPSEIIARSYELEASEYIEKTYNKEIIKTRISNIIRLYGKESIGKIGN